MSNEFAAEDGEGTIDCSMLEPQVMSEVLRWYVLNGISIKLNKTREVDLTRKERHYVFTKLSHLAESAGQTEIVAELVLRNGKKFIVY